MEQTLHDKTDKKKKTKKLQTLNPSSGRADLSQWAGMPLNPSVCLMPLQIIRHDK